MMDIKERSEKPRRAAREIAQGAGSGMYHSFMDFLELSRIDALLSMEIAETEAEMLRLQGAARAVSSMISQIKSLTGEEQ